MSSDITQQERGSETVAATRRAQATGSFKATFQRWIIWIHRWLGVVACLFFVMWFASGIVLAYVRFPAMTLDDRLSVLAPVEADNINTTPGEALSAAGLNEFPDRMRLEMSADRPFYRITDWSGQHHTVAADTGEPIKGVSPERAVEIVRDQTGNPQATLKKANLRSDQWTVTGYWNKERPFHVVQLNDAKNTHYYVSIASGEIVLDTVQTERLWNYVGAVPHWLYFEFVRHDTGLWAWSVYIIAGIGIFVALSGLWVGIDRLRLRAKYANGSVSPFKGLMKWHHILGVVGGLFLALWIITGFWTMYPGGVLETRYITKSEHNAYAGDTSTQFALGTTAALAEAEDARRITFRRIGGEPFAVMENGNAPAKVIRVEDGSVEPLTLAQVEAAAGSMMPDHEVTQADFLPDGDEYWHSGFYPKKTPIIRVRFDDPEQSWFHIDPDTGEILGLVNNESRIDRWTVVAIHDLDFKWLLDNRPWWDFLLFFTTIPGLALSITALVIGWRRLQRVGLVPVGSGPEGQAIAEEAAGDAPQPASRAAVLIAYATQTGSARQLAEQTARALEAANLSVRIQDMATLTPASIAAHRRAVFIVSTAGDGDPPDNVIPFQRRHMRASADFSTLQYALLALGGLGHGAYCKFGLEVDHWLAGNSASRLHDPICVDELDEASLREWAGQLSEITGVQSQIDLERAPFKPWILSRRECVNPGSQGQAVYHLEFEPAGKLPSWYAGDIAQLAMGDAEHDAPETLPLREYSIASLPMDGKIHLLVREMFHPDGQKGLGSAWLIDSLQPGDALPLRIRENAGFHAPSMNRKIVLIGNGTGIAGLRAHLKKRAADDAAPAWLIFGERNSAFDRPYQTEIDGWLQSGVLERADLVFSRDQEERRYVQHHLRDAAADLRQWVSDGAAILVCGSLEGMAPAVHEALVDILGEDIFEHLASSGRYRRDVY
ncbi:MAG: flavodoxin domain-containing protein [Henriciella sp.]|uniref:flavodoxin domain-containing protein n=1 Tax=Henriciella sp. TaxID=1968823 RepID=UPI003C73068C